MTHYLMSVHGPTEMGEFGSYGSKEEMEAAFAATGAAAGASPRGSSVVSG